VQALLGAAIVAGVVAVLFWKLNRSPGASADVSSSPPPIVVPPLEPSPAPPPAPVVKTPPLEPSPAPTPAPVVKTPAPVPSPAPTPAPVVKTPPPTPASVAPALEDPIAEAKKLRRKGKLAEALSKVNEAISDKPTGAAFTLRADLLLASGDKRAALDAASQAVQLSPKSATAWRTKGTIHYDLEDYAGAKAAFERYLAIAPGAKDATEVRLLIDSI
jgi:outer membrane biosynthesis protein TonB